MAKRKTAVVAAEHSITSGEITQATTPGPVIEGALAEVRAAAQGQTLEIPPELVVLDPVIAGLRSWTGTSHHEQTIPELARMIAEEGQRYPGEVRQAADGSLVLITGGRRLKAVQLLREGGMDILFKAFLVEVTEDQALRIAMAENIQREQFTAIELGRNIGMIRKRFAAQGWDSPEGTDAVADFIGISSAGVTQAERLLTLPVEIQTQIEEGRLTPSNALELIANVPSQGDRPEVLRQAQVMAEAERVEKDRQKREKAGKKGQTGTMAASEGAGEGEETPEPQKPARVTGKHIRKAAKKVLGGKAKVLAPKVGEIRDLFEGWSGPASPVVLADFADVFVAYTQGKAKDSVVEKAWDAIAAKLPRDTKAEKEARAERIEKAEAAVAKAQAKGKGKK